MRIVPAQARYLEEAAQLAAQRYARERDECPALPPLDLASFAGALAPLFQPHLGSVALSGGRLTGFLCGCEPFEGAFGRVRGMFSPMHAHGAADGQAREVYPRLYAQVCRQWLAAGALSHAVAVYAHDAAAERSLFENGFGMRTVDAMRPMSPLYSAAPAAWRVEEVTDCFDGRLRQLACAIGRHLAQPPCCLVSEPGDGQPDAGVRSWAALSGESPVGLVQLRVGGETLASWHASVRNVCGMYVVPEARGRGMAEALLNCAARALAGEGVTRMGVDYESINPQANRFWPRYFEPYTRGLVRRMDERVLERGGGSL